MPAFITLGRVLFAVLFIYSGATKLVGLQATTDFIAAKVAIPAMLLPYTSQLETMTGMSTQQTLAIAVGAFEIIAGVMIALNFGARFFAILMIFFVAATIFYFHDFWNQSPPDNAVHDRGIWRPGVAGGGTRLWRCLDRPQPRRDADATGGVEDLGFAGFQAVRGQYGLR